MSFPEDSRIKYDDRVRFVDKKGLCHYGNARWYGRRTRQKSWDDSLKIGILTVLMMALAIVLYAIE